MEGNWNLDIDSYPKRLITCDGETLADKNLPPTKYIIKGLLPQGLALLSGSPKVGKSWLTLNLVVRIAKGEQIWNFPTDRGATLYISLEDTESRLQERLLTITEEAPPDVHFATNCLTIGDGLEEQIRNFVTEHPHTVLVAIDIFQKVRSNSEVSYSVDYNEMEILKQLSQELKIAILLVHHVRKEKADDPFYMISGSNGLAGCADTEFVLLKSKRSSGDATLHCTGRDIEDREINLRFCKETCTWEYISDSVENPETLLPTELQKLIEMMKEKSFFSGSNADFVALFNTYAGTDIKANALKRKMNKWRLELEEQGVTFESGKRDNVRTIDIYLSRLPTVHKKYNKYGMYDIEECPKYRLYRPYRPEPFNSVVAPRVPLCRLFNVKLGMYPNPKIARIRAIVRVFVRRKNPDKNTQL